MFYSITAKGASVFAAWGLAALLAGAAHAGASPPGDRPVGEVTMSVGPVIRTSAQGVPEAVRRGSPIRPGDRIDTAEGGHLHIRFIDGALVSVRPGSRLWVEDYQYDPQKVSLSLVRFKLEYGVARAISGAAAEGAKDRFRLNTPLVAIGVRGTDFVVRSGDQGTTAAVNQGAIVMAPFGDGCQAQSLGPCGSSTARLLSADMGQLLVEFRSQFSQPEIKPIEGGVFAANAAEGVANAGRPGPLGTGTVISRSESDGLAKTALAEGAVQAAIDGRAVPSTPTTPPVVVPDPPVVVVPPPDPVIEPPPALQWGRWAALAAGEGDFSVSRNEAKEGRTSTVGNSQFVLYRAGDAKSVLQSGLGSYQFNLGKSFAQYEAGGQLSAAAVQSGRLTLDFAGQRFSTDLQLTSAATGAVNLAASGFIRNDGLFNDRSVTGQVVAGAAALDGKTAGYFFEKAVGAGLLSGITLWSRP
jgi:hypothetical protein